MDDSMTVKNQSVRCRIDRTPTATTTQQNLFIVAYALLGLLHDAMRQHGHGEECGFCRHLFILAEICEVYTEAASDYVPFTPRMKAAREEFLRHIAPKEDEHEHCRSAS